MNKKLFALLTLSFLSLATVQATEDPQAATARGITTYLKRMYEADIAERQQLLDRLLKQPTSGTQEALLVQIYATQLSDEIERLEKELDKLKI